VAGGQDGAGGWQISGAAGKISQENATNKSDIKFNFRVGFKIHPKRLNKIRKVWKNIKNLSNKNNIDLSILKLCRNEYIIKFEQYYVCIINISRGLEN